MNNLQPPPGNGPPAQATVGLFIERLGRLGNEAYSAVERLERMAERLRGPVPQSPATASAAGPPVGTMTQIGVLIEGHVNLVQRMHEALTEIEKHI